MGRVLIIQNVRAGRGFDFATRVAAQRFHDVGHQAQIAPCRQLTDLDAVLRQHCLHVSQSNQPMASLDAIAVSGGDGSVRALVGRLRPDAPPLAVIADGGGNYIARELRRSGIDGHQPKSTLKAAGRVVVGQANGVAFGLMVGVGLDGFAAALTPKPVKLLSPHLAYGAAIAAAWARYMASPHRLNIVIDGESQAPAPWIMVSNSRFADRRFVLDADGNVSPKLHAIIVRPHGPLDIADVLRRLAMGELATAAHIDIRSCRRVEVTHSAGLPVHGDGEVITHTPVEIIAERTIPILG